MKKALFIALAATGLLATFSCKKDKQEWASGDKGPMTIHFDNRWGDHDLAFAQEETTPNGEKVTLSKLKYYVSNFVLINEDGTKYTVPQDNCYFLLDESVADGDEIELSDVPAGNYTGFTFTLGVDSLRNTKDISQRTGALDVAGDAADMYWTWNSGYIFYKIEGTSPASTNMDNLFWYHMGGFGGYSSPTFNNLKNITLTADESDEEHQPAEVRKDRNPEWHLYVDASKLFSGATTLKISEHPSVMFDPFSVNICNNFPGMFSVNHVHND